MVLVRLDVRRGVSGSRRSRGLAARWSASAARPRAMRERTVPGGMSSTLGDLRVVEADEIAQRDRGAVARATGCASAASMSSWSATASSSAGPRVARLGQRSRPAPAGATRRRASSSAALVATR